MSIVLHSIRDQKDGNSNNHVNYAPFNASNEVDIVWWESLNVAQQAAISSEQRPRLGQISVPHETKVTPDFMKIYWAYIHSFDYHCWFDAVKDFLPVETTVHLLSPNDRHILKEMATRRILRGRDVSHMEIYGDLSSNLLLSLRDALQGPAFVRLSTSSGKNDRPVRPVSSVSELLNYICESPRLQADLAENKTCALVTMPWLEIHPKTEFRVFVYKKRVTCVSQQHWFRNVGLTDATMTAATLNINDWFEASFKLTLPFTDSILDVWIDSGGMVHLIEINPFGAWASSGSSLFHWVQDYTKLHNIDGAIHAAFVSA